MYNTGQHNTRNNSTTVYHRPQHVTYYTPIGTYHALRHIIAHLITRNNTLLLTPSPLHPGHTSRRTCDRVVGRQQHHHDPTPGLDHSCGILTRVSHRNLCLDRLVTTGSLRIGSNESYGLCGRRVATGMGMDVPDPFDCIFIFAFSIAIQEGDNT